LQISVLLILPETKGISLERMDQLFGGLDYVQEGEKVADAKAMEAGAYEAEKQKVIIEHSDKQNIEVEQTEKGDDSDGKDRPAESTIRPVKKSLGPES